MGSVVVTFFQIESYSRGALWFSNSLYCLPYNSYDVCSENLVLDQTYRVCLIQGWEI